MQKIIITRAWCEIHLADCFQAYNEQTGEHYHVGNPESIDPSGTTELAEERHRLEELGYYCRHNSGVWIFIRRLSQPLALPLDWQMAFEERETVDTYQEW